MIRRSESVGGDDIELLSTDFELTHLDVLPVSSDAMCPTILNLVESLSPHLQSVALQNCDVLQLNVLAGTSRSLRKGVLATMDGRTLNISIVKQYSFFGGNSKVISVYIEDGSDMFRFTRIDYCDCGIYYCRPWKKIERLVYFCRYAYLHSVDFGCVPSSFDLNLYNYPSMSFQYHDDCSSASGHEEVFVDRSIATLSAAPDYLRFVSPQHLLVHLGPEFHCFECIINVRGVTSSKSIEFFYEFENEKIVNVAEIMLKLPQPSITFRTTVHRLRSDKFCIKWNYSYIAAFVEQWMLGSRVVEHVHSTMLWYRGHSLCECGRGILQELKHLKLPLKITTTSDLDEKLREQLKSVNVYCDKISFSKDASIIHIYTSVDRLAIILRSAMDTLSADPALHRTLKRGGCIDIIRTKL